MSNSGGYGVARRASKAGAALLLLCGAASAETVEIVALGDSLTQGYGLPQGDGFVPQLQDWLSENGVDARIVNAGVSGDTTAGGRARLGWSLSDETDAVIVSLGGNDLLRGIAPETSAENLDAILAEVSQRGLPTLLVGIDAPANYGSDYEAAFDGMYAELSQEYGTLLYPDFFMALRKDGVPLAGQGDLMQPDGIHPSAEGVSRVVADLGPWVAELAARAE